MKRSAWLFCLVLSLGGSASALGSERCMLGAASAPSAPSSKDDLNEIQESCDGLLVEQDSTRLKKEALELCCRGADAYLKKEPIPPRAASPSSAEDLWTTYRIKLALSTCDAIRSPDLTYQQNLCLTEMLFRIPDERVTDILNACSPIQHSPGKHRSRGGHGAAPGQTPQAEASPAPAAASAKPHGNNLLLNDESFSNCQHEKLEALIERLQSGAARLK